MCDYRRIKRNKSAHLNPVRHSKRIPEYIYLSLILIALIFCIGNLVANEDPLSERIANYKISISLDTETKVISGKERLLWTNNTSSPANELRFHLYLNAFKNPKSTFLRDYSWFSPEDYENMPEEDFGSIQIGKMILDDEVNLTDSVEYIQPDDGNIHDSTVIRVPLPKMIPPGREIALTIDFKAKLPRIFSRTGSVNDFYLLGQWFPKIGVFEGDRWHCHQFFSTSEFYADFGIYEVDITLPRDYTVGATGILVDEESMDSVKTLSFRAEDVHDFAITAWSRFRREEREIEGTRVILLYAPEHQGQVSRYFSVIEGSLRYMADWLMPYPYSQLTIVDPPLYAARAIGMEYPCFIVGGSSWGIPESIKLGAEEATVHEFVHQYFYGILASDEAEEPWMDEGFTTYTTKKILSHLYGLHTSASSFLDIKIGAYDGHKRRYMEKPSSGIVTWASWQFPRGSYGVNTYSKPMLILLTLENYLGQPVMDDIMRAYLDKWKFRHPRTSDFIEVVNERAPENMDWFFEQALYDSCWLDYAVKSITLQDTSLVKSKGLGYSNTIVITRNGNFMIPTEIQSIFANGDTLYKKLNGSDSLFVIKYPGSSPLVSVHVDPNRRLWLDLNWSNNSLTLESQNVTIFSHLTGILRIYQQILASLFFF